MFLRTPRRGTRACRRPARPRCCRCCTQNNSKNNNTDDGDRQQPSQPTASNFSHRTTMPAHTQKKNTLAQNNALRFNERPRDDIGSRLVTVVVFFFLIFFFNCFREPFWLRARYAKAMRRRAAAYHGNTLSCSEH